MADQAENEPSAGAGLGPRAARGAAATLGAQLTRIAIQLASVVVLARLLTPHDYGLIAMVVAVIGVGEVLRDFGLSSAAIQAPELSLRQRDKLFWVNAGIGAALAVVVFSCAGLFALAYHQPELIPVSQALSVTFLLNGFATQYRADLTRRLKFMKLATADVTAPAVALALAIAAGIVGWGYWALVTQQIATAVILLLMLAIGARWLPGRPRRGVPIRAFLRFGGNLVGAQLVGYLSNNLDSVLIGVRFGAGPLGIYTRAYQLLMTPLNQLRTPLTTVALPVLSRITADVRRFGDFVCQGQLALGYTVVAGLGLIASAPESFTEILLGDQWLAAAPILRLFAVAGIFQILAFVGYWVYTSRGLTGDLFRYSLLSAAIKVACIVGGSAWGVIGIAIGYALAPAISWPISLWWLSRRAVLPIGRLYAGAGRILGLVVIAAGAAALIATALARFGPMASLGGAAVTGIAVYLLAALLLRPVRRDLATVVRMVRMIPARRGV
jgi:PST family polysaccharide transporter